MDLAQRYLRYVSQVFFVLQTFTFPLEVVVKRLPFLQRSSRKIRSASRLTAAKLVLHLNSLQNCLVVGSDPQQFAASANSFALTQRSDLHKGRCAA